MIAVLEHLELHPPAMHSISRQARHYGVSNHAVGATRSASATLGHINRMQAVQHVAAALLQHELTLQAKSLGGSGVQLVNLHVIVDQEDRQRDGIKNRA